MKSYRVSEVFVPGGLPTHTYVSRSERGLEQGLEGACDNLCKIATVTGATKCGKTVLVRKVLAKRPLIWIDGGHISTLADFWAIVAEQLSIASETQTNDSEETGNEVSGEIGAEGNIFFAKGTGKLGSKLSTRSSNQSQSKRTITRSVQVSKALIENKIPIVIDDFHYLNRDLQGQVTRAVKPLVFDGVPVVYLAIPHRRYDAVKVEREMNGRIELISVPSWSIAELMAIAEQGFPLINISPDKTISEQLAKEAHGSPHLMQEFCKKICHLSELKETSEIKRVINTKFNYNVIFETVAVTLGKNIYDKLAKGPRPRSDRLPRKLKSGGSVDIYKVVLRALSNLRPGVMTIEYETLRASIRDILADDLPQAHEVSRVLEQMAKVSALDESSVPVIDYEKDEKRLHITDPFFAFFLKWGDSLINAE